MLGSLLPMLGMTGPWGALIGMGGGIGLSLLNGWLFGDDTTSEKPEEPPQQGLSRDISFDPTHPFTLLVGRCKTSGSYAYAQVSDRKIDGTIVSGERQNRYFDSVTVLCDAPITAIDRIRVCGKWQNLTGDPATDGGKLGVGSNWYTIDIGNETDAQIWRTRASLGNHNNADNRLVEASNSDKDGGRLWTEDHKILGKALGFEWGRFNAKRHKEWPSTEWVVQGIKFYRQSLDGSNGGTGAHRIDNPNTWAYSDIPSVIIQHFLRGYTVGPSHLLGPMAGEVDNTYFDLETFNNSDAKCASNFDTRELGNIQQYSAGGEVILTQAFGDIIDTFLICMAGELYWTGARWRCFAGEFRSPTGIDIDDRSWVLTDEVRYQYEEPRANRYSGVTGRFLPQQDIWEFQDLPPRRSSQAVEEDAGDEDFPLNMDFVSDDPVAQYLMEIKREKLRRFKRFAGKLGPEFFDIEVGDVKSVSSDIFPGLSSAITFLVAKVTQYNDFTSYVELVEFDAEIFAWVKGTDEFLNAIRDLSDGDKDPVDEIPTITVEAFTDRGENDELVAGLDVTWTPPEENDRIDSIGFQWRLKGKTRTSSGHSQWVHDGEWQSPTSLAPNTKYEIRPRWVYRDGPGKWGNWIEVTTASEFTVAWMAVPDIAVSQTLLVGGDGNRYRPASRVSFTEASMTSPGNGGTIPPTAGPDPAIKGFEVRYRKVGEGNTEWQYEQNFNVSGADGGVRSLKFFKGLQSATSYEYMGRFLFRGGLSGDWSTLATSSTLRTFDSLTAPIPNITASAISADDQRGKDKTDARVGLRVVWTLNSMKYPTSTDPVDPRIIDVEIGYQRQKNDSSWSDTVWERAGINATDAIASEPLVFETTRNIHQNTPYRVVARFVFDDTSFHGAASSTFGAAPVVTTGGDVQTDYPTAEIRDVGADDTLGDLMSVLRTTPRGRQIPIIRGSVDADADPRVRGIDIRYRQTSDGNRWSKLHVRCDDDTDNWNGNVNSRRFLIDTNLLDDESYTLQARFVFEKDRKGPYGTARVITTEKEYLAVSTDQVVDNAITDIYTLTQSGGGDAIGSSYTTISGMSANVGEIQGKMIAWLQYEAEVNPSGTPTLHVKITGQASAGEVDLMPEEDYDPPGTNWGKDIHIATLNLNTVPGSGDITIRIQAKCTSSNINVRKTRAVLERVKK